MSNIDSKVEAAAIEAVYVHRLNTPQAVKFVQRAVIGTTDEQARGAISVVAKSRFKYVNGKFVSA